MIYSIENFFEFEKSSNIFQIKNDKGIYLWDIFRYFAKAHLEENCTTLKSSAKRNFLIVKILKSIFVIPRYFCFFFGKKKYDNLFFMASRNQYEGTFIDQNQFDTYKEYSGQNNLIIETWERRNYKFYKAPLMYYGYIRLFVKFFYHIELSEDDCLCVHTIYELVKNNIRKIYFTEKDLLNLLSAFYLDVYLWNKILKGHQVKRVFLTQNGIQKGFFYAAKRLDVPVFEYQHGIIGKTHPTYSYPNIEDVENYIYMPYKFLTLSDYWCKNFNCPMANQEIGNNYFSKPVKKVAKPDKILVISADVFGKQLAKILKDGINEEKINSSDLIFKLHPNQYFEKEYFMEFFDGKVSVVTDEKSVNELLSYSKCMITVCSTAAFEALQANTRVLIYTISMYKDMELLFDDKNVFLFSNIEELRKGIKAELPEDYKAPVFFEKCTPEKIKLALNGDL